MHGYVDCYSCTLYACYTSLAYYITLDAVHVAAQMHIYAKCLSANLNLFMLQLDLFMYSKTHCA